MNAVRLQQILDYAKALKVAAQYGRGSIKDTADIVKALEDLQAFQQFRPDRATKPEQIRKVA